MATGFSKTRCVHCRGKIEFPSEGVGLPVSCPHCGNETILKRPRLSKQDLIIMISVGGFFLLAGVVGLADFVVHERKEAKAKAEREQREAEQRKEDEIASRIRQAVWAAQVASQPTYLERQEAQRQQRARERLAERQVRALEDANNIAEHSLHDQEYYRMQSAQRERDAADAAQRIADQIERERFERMYRRGY